jgi:cell division protein FtsW
VILTLFAILIWRGIRVALNATDLFGTLVASGIVIMVASQVIINIAVVTNSIPNTGVPLPFISYGGTSVAIVMMLMGILLNISRYSR